jgi:small-conductance mechanosensitive channel
MRSAVLLLWVAVAVAGPGMARAQPAPDPAPVAPEAALPAANLSPAQAAQVLDVLQDAAKRDQFIGTLQAIAKALPAQPAPVSQPAAKPAPPSKTQAAAVIAPHSLGADLARQASQRLGVLSAQLVDTARTVTQFPLLWRWLRQIAESRSARIEIARAGWRLLLVLGLGLAAEGLARFALRRPHHAVETSVPAGNSHETEHLPDTGEADTSALAAAEAGETEFRRRRPSALAMMRRVPFVVLRLLLALVPLAAFIAGSYVALALVEPDPNTRLVILTVVEAYLTWRVVLVITRMLLAPAAPRLRLVHLSDATAAYIFRWVQRIVAVAVFGRAVADIGLLYGLYPAAHDALLKLFVLIAHLFLVVVVLQNRHAVARHIRAEPGRTGLIATLRNGLAEVSAFLAIAYIMAAWLVWAFEVPNGYHRLLRFFVVTAAIVLVSRLVALLALGALDRCLRIPQDAQLRFPGLQARALRYRPVLRTLIAGVIDVATLLALLESWGLDVGSWFDRGAFTGRAAGALLVVVLTLIASVFAWEAVNLYIQRHLERLAEEGQAARAARLRTILPTLRAAILIALLLVAAPTALAEIGVNIGPLLAGAGIVGVAIGFGAQKLVQDCITGIFLLIEDAMHVGDWVTVAGLSGTVEKLSIRTLRLRGADGSVYIVPFSAVTTVNNTNRGLGNAAVSVNVSYREDTDRVCQVLRDIAEEMRTEAAFERQMLGALELWGVDKVEGSAVTIAGQIACTDAGRWPVQREFNRRLKKRFQELGIEIPNPTQTVVLQRVTGPRGPGQEERPEAPPAVAPEPLAAAARGTPH